MTGISVWAAGCGVIRAGKASGSRRDGPTEPRVLLDFAQPAWPSSARRESLLSPAAGLCAIRSAMLMLPCLTNGTGRAREENSTADARRCTQMRTEPIRLTVAIFPGRPKQHGASALIGVHPRSKFFAWDAQNHDLCTTFLCASQA
jgi:hypothetical protein